MTDPMTGETLHSGDGQALLWAWHLLVSRQLLTDEPARRAAVDMVQDHVLQLAHPGARVTRTQFFRQRLFDPDTGEALPDVFGIIAYARGPQ